MGMVKVFCNMIVVMSMMVAAVVAYLIFRNPTSVLHNMYQSMLT